MKIKKEDNIVAVISEFHKVFFFFNFFNWGQILDHNGITADTENCKIDANAGYVFSLAC